MPPNLHRRTFLIGSLGLTAATVARPASATTTRARAVLARTLDELRKAIAASKPGAEIVLANGTYAVPGDETIAISAKHGTAAAPITVRAESVGGVTLTGNNGFALEGSSYVVIDGFTLRQQTTFEVPTTCQHIRISRNDIQLGDIEGSHWVMVRADATVVAGDAGDAHALADRDAAHPRALGEGLGKVGGIRLAVAGNPDSAAEVVGAQDRRERSGLRR